MGDTEKRGKPEVRSGVAGGGVRVVSEEGRGSGGCAPGKNFSFSSPKQWGFIRFRVQERFNDNETKKPLPDERLKNFLKSRVFCRRTDEAQNERHLFVWVNEEWA